MPYFDIRPAEVLGLIMRPIGAALFDFGAYYHNHWIIVLIGKRFLAFIATARIPPATIYEIEVFKEHLQEVGTAANTWKVVFSMPVQFL